jgi:hypothetical protein
MIYSEILDLAKSYADRENDVEINSKMDSFFRIVEARVNRSLKHQKMSSRVTINSIADQTYYGLPADFDGLREIQITDGTSCVTTPSYHSPEQINNRVNGPSPGIAYNILADQLQIQPAQDGAVIELVYYQTLLPLSSGNITNWLSELYPDCYLFGLMVEINAFVKDPQTAQIWDTRFKESISEIDLNDQITRWSGPSLQVRIG